MKTDSKLLFAAGIVAFGLLAFSFLTPISSAGCNLPQCIQIGVGTGNKGDPCWLGIIDGQDVTGWDYAKGYADNGYGNVAMGGAPAAPVNNNYDGVTGTPDCSPLKGGTSGAVLTVYANYSGNYNTKCAVAGGD